MGLGLQACGCVLLMWSVMPWGLDPMDISRCRSTTPHSVNRFDCQTCSHSRQSHSPNSVHFLSIRDIWIGSWSYGHAGRTHVHVCPPGWDVQCQQRMKMPPRLPLSTKILSKHGPTWVSNIITKWPTRCQEFYNCREVTLVVIVKVLQKAFLCHIPVILPPSPPQYIMVKCSPPPPQYIMVKCSGGLVPSTDLQGIIKLL